MARNASGHIIIYNDVLFDRLRTHMLMVDDNAYVRMDFREDPNLSLPEGSQWGDIGKKDILFI
jgi:hypothetical protein